MRFSYPRGFGASGGEALSRCPLSDVLTLDGGGPGKVASVE